MSSELNTYEYEILSESPANEDGLSDGIHENVVNQLLGVFESSSKGIAIGLEGKWGSGKSTIINLLKRKLPAESAHIYIFDAWAHEGDPLRRIFLEGLLESIQGKYEFEQIEELKSSVSGRTKTVEVRSKSRVSRLGKYLGISGLFLPLGAAVLSAIDYSKLVFPFAGTATVTVESALFWVGFVVCLSPFGVLAYWGVNGDNSERDKKQKDWSVIAGSSSQDYTQDITEDGERSSIEFESYFKLILSTLFKLNSNLKKVVVVLDNLDRVDHESAKSVWSSLQPFFQYQNGSNPEVDKLWFIVPHDKYALSRIWESSDSKDIGQSFIDKSLQVNIDVPLPIHSSWSNYLSDSVGLALTGYNHESQETVISVYKRYASNLSQVPTPRKLRQYVNQVGVIGFKWKERVSIEAIALYSLLRTKYSSDELQNELISNNIFRNYSSISDEDILLSELAGMLFGVSSEKGIEVLLGQQLSDCILRGDIEGAHAIADNHPTAIEAIVHAKWTEIIPESNHTEEYKINFIKSLQNIFILNREKFAREIRQTLDIWSSELVKWEFSKYDYSDVLPILRDLDSNWSGFKAIQDNVILDISKKVISNIGTEKYNEIEYGNSIKFYNELKKYAPKLNLRAYSSIDVEKWKSYIAIYEEKGFFLDFVQPPIKTIEALIDSIGPSTINNENCKIILTSIELCKTLSVWKKLSESLLKWLQTHNRVINVDEIYQIWNWVIEKGYTPENYLDLLKVNQFISRSNQEVFTSVPSSAVFYAKIYKEKILDSTLPTPVRDFLTTEQDQKLLKEVTLIFKSFDAFNDLWNLSRDSRNTTVISILKTQLENNDFLRLTEPSTHIDEFDWLNDGEKVELAQKLIFSGSFDKIKRHIRNNLIPYHQVLYIFSRVENAETQLFIKEILLSATKEDWLSDFEIDNQDNPLRSLASGTLSVAFKDAFEQVILSITDGETTYMGVLNDFEQAFTKVVDLDSLKRIFTTNYIKNPEICLSDSKFKSLQLVLDMKESTHLDKELIANLDFWLKSDLMEHLKWFSSQSNHHLEANETIKKRIIGDATETLRNLPEIRIKLAEIFDLTQELEDFELSGQEDS